MKQNEKEYGSTLGKEPFLMNTRGSCFAIQPHFQDRGSNTYVQQSSTKVLFG